MEESELDVHSERLNTVMVAMGSASEVFSLLTSQELSETEFLLKTKETLRKALVFCFRYEDDEMRSDLAERFKLMPVGTILPLLDDDASAFMPKARTLLLGSEQELDALFLSWRRKPAKPVDPMTLPVTNAGLIALGEDIKAMLRLDEQIKQNKASLSTLQHYLNRK